jgi:hypothetical protein
MGDIIAVDVDRHDCRRSFWRARSTRRANTNLRNVEEAKIGAFELPAERAEAGEPRAPNQRAPERAPGLMLTSWTLERISRKIKI